MKDKPVVLITGCSTGIGRELSRVLYENGYIVVATARNLEILSDLSATLKLALDVTDRESIKKAVDQIDSLFGRIDILINNAGYSIRGAIEEINVESMKKMFDVNVFGIVNMIQTVLPVMRKSSSGKIINIGSISGKFAQPVNGSYCASKFSVEAITDVLRLELHKQSIQVSVLEPGPVQTEFFKTMEDNSDHILMNSASIYSNLYQRAKNRKDTQIYAHPTNVATRTLKIIKMKRIKARYQIAVPFIFKIITNLPDSIKEYLMLHG